MDSQTIAFSSEWKTMSRPRRAIIERCLLWGALSVQAAHCGLLLLSSPAPISSNILQVLPPFVVTLVCLYRGSISGEQGEAQLWRKVSAAFAVWTSGQVVFLWSMVFKVVPRLVPYSDMLWLVFAFPLLLVASSTPRTSRRDAVGWLDTAQSCIFFILVFALVYSRVPLITLPQAYNAQSVALLLTVAIRYSISEPGVERLFFRNLAAFSGLYSICSAAAYAVGKQGYPDGRLIDLCWSLPFTAFVIMVLGRKLASAPLKIRADARVHLPRYLHGISALGLAVMSLLGAGVLARQHTVAGTVMLLIAFSLFVARTSTREWQLHTAHDRLRHSALHDSLTGLANRALLEQELSQRLEETRVAAGRRTALLFIDLDRFKTINDGLGHAFGDLLLIRVATLLRSAVRSQDLVARHGGDEFVILLEQVDATEAEMLAQRVIESLRTPLELSDRVVHVTASVGIVLSGPGATSAEMLQDADCAMYKAKHGGKDRAQTFAPKMLSSARDKLEMECELRRMLSAKSLPVHYQPIYDLASNTIQGFEALARWEESPRGAVSPAEFIPLAEDTGLIIQLGKQVLQRACRQCREWNVRFGASLTVAVNVSARQFAHPDLFQDIVEALRDSELDPDLLKLEITESALLSNYQTVEEVLTRVRALGTEVCLDDFGTGYSSLGYLLRFPFDVLKIDRSFVRHLDRDHRRAEMVRMVIQLAATLKKKCVAEGVESEEELRGLRSFGCDMVQGYLFSKALCPEDAATLLKEATSSGELERSGDPRAVRELPALARPLRAVR